MLHLSELPGQLGDSIWHPEVALRGLMHGLTALPAPLTVHLLTKTASPNK